ncbi:conserved hypothetical protein [Rhodopseudomonas palustris BisB5]|uniref:Uncharacterized protein n=1 Tax=Rhodopseudomonas palustris (strain BisB5) TaxID=316057 RepID=Q138I4_RHOPS|nr:conserved hypothetical protein [Rhodopseudomonas palustris BisB5]
MGTWTAALPDRTISISRDRLARFRKLYVPDRDLSARMSEQFLFDMYVLGVAYGISPFEILQSVRHLEAGEPPGGIKPASMFSHPPLRGLWHKHYFSARFMPHNILMGLGGNGLERLIVETMGSSESPVITKDIISELARRVANEPLEMRHQQGKITGEWIIFARHSGVHYYLCLSTHDTGDQIIHDQIMKNCLKDFPKLRSWMDEQASSAAP